MVVIESSYMLCPFGDLQEEPGQHRIVAAEHPLQIEIGTGEGAGSPDIRKRECRPGYELLNHAIRGGQNSGGPADQVAVHLAGDIGIQPDDLRHAVEVKRTGDEDTTTRRYLRRYGRNHRHRVDR